MLSSPLPFSMQLGYRASKTGARFSLTSCETDIQSMDLGCCEPHLVQIVHDCRVHPPDILAGHYFKLPIQTEHQKYSMRERAFSSLKDSEMVKKIMGFGIDYLSWNWSQRLGEPLTEPPPGPITQTFQALLLIEGQWDTSVWKPRCDFIDQGGKRRVALLRRYKKEKGQGSSAPDQDQDYWPRRQL